MIEGEIVNLSTIPKSQLVFWWLIEILPVVNILFLFAGLIEFSKTQKLTWLYLFGAMMILFVIATILYRKNLFYIKDFYKLFSVLNIKVKNKKKNWFRLLVYGYGYICGSEFKYLIEGYRNKIHVFACIEKAFFAYNPIGIISNNRYIGRAFYMNRTSQVNLFYPCDFPYTVDIEIEIINGVIQSDGIQDIKFKKNLFESAKGINFLKARLEGNKKWVRLIIMGGAWEGKIFGEKIRNGIIFFNSFVENLTKDFRIKEEKREISFDETTGSFYIKGEIFPYSTNKLRFKTQAILWTALFVFAFLWAVAFLIGFTRFDDGRIFLGMPSYPFLFIFSVFTVILLSFGIAQQKSLFKPKDFKKRMAQNLGLTEISKETKRHYHLYQGLKDNIYICGIIDKGSPLIPIDNAFGAYKWLNFIEMERLGQVNLFYLFSNHYNIDFEIKSDTSEKSLIGTGCPEINEVVSDVIKGLDYFHWRIIFNDQWLRLVIIGGSWQGKLFARNIESGINMFKELITKMQGKYPDRDWKDYKVRWDKKTWEFYLEKI
jgi:hypothetical protein